MKELVMRVAGRGCPGCIATALVHIFRIKGVRGARVVGTEVVVLLDDSASPEVVVKDRALNEYYRILSWSVRPAEGPAHGIYKIALRRDAGGI
ncbi:MAG: hypothetical protein ABWK00_02950 [Desulfurococcaceae archaeon]